VRVKREDSWTPASIYQVLQLLVTSVLVANTALTGSSRENISSEKIIHLYSFQRPSKTVFPSQVQLVDKRHV
jgi:Fe2+ or Zn2+ uptake regulation protein